MGIRKPIGITLIPMAGIAMVASCATMHTKVASPSLTVPPPAVQSEPAAKVPQTEPPAGAQATAKPPAQKEAAVSSKPVPAKAAPVVRQASRNMRTNEAGRAIIKQSEGLHLAAYQDNGQWLIGYGHSKRVKPGMTISAAQADSYLAEDLAACEASVSAAVAAPITPNQFSAMVSLCYNIGTGRFASSTLVKRLNAGDEQTAADAFLDWSKATVNGQRIVLPRLLARRQQERALFLDGINPPRA